LIKKQSKYEIFLYIVFYAVFIIFLAANQKYVDDFIEHGNETTKLIVNITLVVISIIIAFRLKNIYSKNK